MCARAWVEGKMPMVLLFLLLLLGDDVVYSIEKLSSQHTHTKTHTHTHTHTGRETQFMPFSQS